MATQTPTKGRKMSTTIDDRIAAFDHDSAVAELAEIVRRCDDDVIGEGCAWYDGYAQARCREIARETGVSENVAIGLACAYNINSTWEGGLTAARRNAPRKRSGGLPAARKAADRIKAGERPTDVLGHMPKIGRFYRNIALRDFDCVTVDRWAARACGYDSNPTTEREYLMIERAYQDAAAMVGLPPAMVQAIVWIVVRGSGV
jgi:hypothetical protein